MLEKNQKAFVSPVELEKHGRIWTLHITFTENSIIAKSISKRVASGAIGIYTAILGHLLNDLLENMAKLELLNYDSRPEKSKGTKSNGSKKKSPITKKSLKN